ncbi:MAG TPA: 6-carboxytetrahydropterin synthase [Polyangiaceae bacterium]|jgi:6-pyruvoyltetrahydropterin/6-carboxytetrahydropterin synthase
MLNAGYSMPMWEISVETVVAARHQIRGVAGEGGRVHEHRWGVRVVVRARELDRTGWVLDFHAVDAALEALVAPYRGAFLNEVAPFDDVNPTRENVARVIAEGLAGKVDDGRARVHRVEVSEAGHCASYVRDDA